MNDNFSESHTPEGLNSSTPECETTTIKCGIFYADQDINIAKRIRDAIQHSGCTASLFNFLQAGKQKLDQVESFICEHEMVLWIATSTSLQDRAILKAARHIANYAAIAKPEMKMTYITVKPREYLSLELPLLLESYTCLIENDDFETSVKVTLAAIREERANAEAANAEQSTATTNAISDDANNSLRQVAASADIGETATPSSQKVDDSSRVTIVNINYAVKTLQISDIVVNQEENLSGKENVNKEVKTGCRYTTTSKPKCFGDDDDDDTFFEAVG